MNGSRRIAVCAAGLFILAACGSASTPTAQHTPATNAHAGSAPAAKSGAKLPITIAYEPDGDAPLYLAHKLHLFAKNGLAAKLLEFESGPPMFAATKSGAADVMAAGTGPTVTGPLKGIPQIAFMVAHEDSAISGLVARNGSGIHSVAELRGKAVGALHGSGTYFALLQTLAKNHMSLKDLKYKNLTPPALLAAFKAGQIQASWIWAPWAQDMAASGGHFVTTNAQQGIYQPVVWAVNTNWAKGHRATLLKFIGVIQQAVRYTRAHPNQAAKTLSQVMHINMSIATLIEKKDIYPTVKQQLGATFKDSFTSGYQNCSGGFGRSALIVAGQLKAQRVIKTVPSCHVLYTPKYLQAYSHSGQ